MNTKNLTNISYMFYSFVSLTRLDLSNCNTSNVIDMKCMFIGCYFLKELNLLNYNTKNVTNMCLCLKIAELLKN